MRHLNSFLARGRGNWTNIFQNSNARGECEASTQSQIGFEWYINSWMEAASAWYQRFHSKNRVFFCPELWVDEYGQMGWIGRTCQRRTMETSTVIPLPPPFYYIWLSPSFNSVGNFIGNLWQIILQGNHLKIHVGRSNDRVRGVKGASSASTGTSLVAEGTIDVKVSLILPLY